MEVLRIHEKQIKELTEFIIEKNLILHPLISPNGVPDFSDFMHKKYTLIIDRNIMTKIIELCRTGTLKDRYILKVVSSLLFWSHFNDISLTGGLALNEYANIKKDNNEASAENNIFLRLFNQYPTKTWLDLFERKITFVPIIKILSNKDYEFDVKNGHQQMHLAEVLHIFYLYVNKELTVTEKMIELLKWIDKNILFCAYTIVYAALLFSKQIKQPKIQEFESIDNILRKSSNQAWDLTYLSFWSTLYWNENKGDTIHLFATMDKDLKKIFMNTHNTDSNLFVRCFGEKEGKRINIEYERILSNRHKPIITDEIISKLVEKEISNIKNTFRY
ncbi:hypothetical protein [Bacillus inaquosorum]|uniref:hypothetical protein n=1 Tax=Bacillus inaquosorum TaxID=483913 RepID=UPI0011E9077D|nr:hypothetical protein [Bacillus inaquosorum]MCY8786794.1 hypothetical protein [Bacillus inaquosorum]MCY9082663.1 hypothetical protein [Bacillus inaquosorum]MCY9176505.1 hypothetical protein [Bacillus inaquosorum]TYS23156.1 hypothetical protein FZC71_08815 [Bacillus subtilis]